MFLVYVVLCLIVFGCQYQCNCLPGKTRLRMTYYVSSGTLNPTHSLSKNSIARDDSLLACRCNYGMCIMDGFITDNALVAGIASSHPLCLRCVLLLVSPK